MALYDYQRRAVDQTWAYIRQYQGNPCIVIPTGGGKTHVMAQMISDCLLWKKRMIVATHTIGLLRQLESNLEAYGIASSQVGYFSDSAKSFETDRPVILATIQSIHNKGEIFGRRDVLFVDECHRVNPTDPDTNYGRLIQSYPDAKIIGLTATPYRMKGGLICDEGSVFSKISCEVTISELLTSDPPRLCRLRSKWLDGIDTSKLTISSTGDFVQHEEQEAFLAKVQEVCEDMHKLCEGRKSIIVFCSGIEHCEAVKDFLRNTYGEECEVIIGSTPDAQREWVYDTFRGFGVRWLINCNVLTEGFDARNIDAVVLQRATVSPGLYYQMAGRGLRLHESKQDCLVLDYGENIARHGPIDKIDPGKRKRQGSKKDAPVKACPQCFEAVAVSVRECPSCGHEWEIDETPKIKNKASNESILSDGSVRINKNGFLENTFYSLSAMNVSLHTRKRDGVEIVKIEYMVNTTNDSQMGLLEFQVEFKDFQNPKSDGLMTLWWQKLRSGIRKPAFNGYAYEVLKEYAEDEARRPTAVKWVLKPGKNPDFPDVIFSFAGKYKGDVWYLGKGDFISPDGTKATGTAPDDWRKV